MKFGPSAASLAEMAQQLTVLIGHFKLGSGDSIDMLINLAKEAHLEWINRIEQMLTGNLTLSEKDVGSDHECILGQWYFGRASREYANIPEFAAIEKPHSDLHKVVQQTICAYNRGDIKIAQEQLPTIERYSHEIVNLIDRFEVVMDKNQKSPNLIETDLDHIDEEHRPASLVSQGSNGRS